MQVFLTGATGYIGSVIAEKLQEKGHTVVGLSRSEQSAAKMRAKGITPFAGDLRDAASVAAGAKQTEATIHAGFIHDMETFSAEEFEKSAQAERDNVHALLDVLAGTNKTFLLTSGTGVIGDTGESVFGEDTPFQAPPYIRWRQELEQNVLHAASRGVRSAVIRPPMVYGRGGSMFPTMLLTTGQKAGVGIYINDGENRWSTVQVDDLADLYVLAMEKSPAGTLLHSTSGNPVSVKEMAEAVSRNIGAEGKTRSWPIQEASTELGMLAGGLAANMRVSSDKTKELLDWHPSRPSILIDLSAGSYATPQKDKGVQ